MDIKKLITVSGIMPVIKGIILITKMV